MKIKYLGTAAAEGIPAVFCTCDTCSYARKHRGKNIRSRSQTLINDSLMIDFPPDAFYHSVNYQLIFSKIHHYLITHVHPDHYFGMDLDSTAQMVDVLPEDVIFNFYGSTDLEKEISQLDHKPQKISFHCLEPFHTYDIENIKVTPLKAHHGTDNPFIYLLESEGKTVLYAHDTGMFTEETLDYLFSRSFLFDLISFDCTKGSGMTMIHSSHMCLGNLLQLKKLFEEKGMINRHTVLIVNHFSHNGSDVLYEARGVYEKEGFTMTYDGFEIEI